MKILITTDAYTAMINGVAISVKTLASALEEAGHEVRILTLSQTHHSYIDRNIYAVGSVPLKIYPDTRASLQLHDPLVEELIIWAPDIIHSQSEFFTFLFAKRIAKQLQIPIVHTYHTLYEYYTHYFCPNKTIGRSIVATVSRFICQKADAIIAPTQKTEKILEGYGVTNPIHVVPTGLSFDRFHVTTDDSFTEQIRTKFRIPSNAPVLVTLGRIAREKNIDFLIEQMAHSAIRSKNVHLIVVGDGPDRERLESITHNLGLKFCVHFTGMVAPKHVASYYHLGNAFVSASNSETQGLTYIEALACGLPLLCRKDECLQDVLEPNQNGYFFENSEMFVAHCLNLLENSKKLTAMSENALQSSYKFSKESFGTNAISIYQKTILSRRESKSCTRFVCIPKQIWHKVTGC